jgi:hypothetical protein
MCCRFLRAGYRGEVRYVAKPVDENIHMHHIGVWTGCFQDIEVLVVCHARRMGYIEYSSWFGNCQHRAATMLVLLEAGGKIKPCRTFQVVYESMH